MNSGKALLDYFVAVLSQVYSITPNAQMIREFRETITMYVNPVPGTKIVAFVGAPALAEPVPPPTSVDDSFLRRTVVSLEADLKAAQYRADDAEKELSRLKDLVRQIYRASQPIIDKEASK